MLKRGGPLKRTGQIKRKGNRMKAWEVFSNSYAIECRDDNGLIECQCTAECQQSLDCPCHWGHVNQFRPDLHHLIGRDGDLLFDKHYLVWLTRKCHERVHAGANNNFSRPGP